MIVPRNRLLFWAGTITISSALLAAAEPRAGAVCMLAVGVLGAAVVADAWRAPQSLVGIGVDIPSVARMSKDREAKLELRIRNELSQQRSLRLALDLPPEIPGAAEDIEVVLPAGSEWSRLAWTCTPVKRGKYHINSAYLEGISTLGFWAARKRLPVQSEIRVYPNLMAERRNVSALFLNRGAFGTHAQRQVGKGRDFEKLREYVPGDSFDDIH